MLLLKIRKKLEYYECDASVGVIPVEFGASSHGGHDIDITCPHLYIIPFVARHLSEISDFQQ